MKLASCFILFLALVLIALSNKPAHSSNGDKSQILQVYIVKEGDSLSKIAYEYYSDYNQTSRIAEFNDIKDINKLKIGQEIKIPVLLLEQTGKPSKIIEEDLDTSRQGAAEIFEENSSQKIE
jgi:LysM repeat protein